MQFTSTLTLSEDNQPLLIEKRIKLLKAIDQEGSMLKASKKVPMSYKSAWEAIDTMNNLSPSPIVEKETGGAGGGGTRLTDYGKTLLKNYEILKREEEKFLSYLSTLADFDTKDIKTIKRISMQISARNQIRGVVDKIVTGDVNANVIVVPKSGHELFANITNSGIESLMVQEGDEVVAIFKSSSIMLSTDENITISARNRISGIITQITQNNTNSEVVIDVGGDSITSVITTGSVKRLGLKVGSQVVALIKSSEIMIGK
ncbi:TOBE domain-containing protein [Sulfurospirillum sp. 1612]|uniref:TOBE domain-containing protein n=1 Tax=Sulfurospirillum sp. 1612 TaxID=3094835 RepID=UPI002F92E597